MTPIPRPSRALFAALLLAHGAAIAGALDIFDDRPGGQRKDAESHIDAIKRERLEQQRGAVAAAQEQKAKGMDDRCGCFYPVIKNGAPCPVHFNFYLVQEDPKASWEEREAARAARAERDRRKAEEFARWQREMHATCKAWETGGRAMSQAEFDRRMSDMQARVAEAGKEEERLVREREMARARAAKAARQAEQDRIHNLAMQPDPAVVERAARDQRRSEEERAARRQAQLDGCHAEVARHGYAYTCACQAILDVPPSERGPSCGK